MTRKTVALLGDSILDNSPYVRPEADSAEHLRRLLGNSWTVELLARDGATMADVPFQLKHLPDATSCAVLSVGGNDAIEHVGLLEQVTTSAADILGPMVAIGQSFRERYDPLVGAITNRVARLILCTIYEPPLADPLFARLAVVPLAVLNDQIIRTAAERRLDVIELRSVCTSPADFVREIEPSPQGAKKIAISLAAAITAPVDARVCRLFAV
jgi:hypothetical protein